ncbi:MAG TPA: cytochrome c [Bacteroidia bacterium]|nr:cytochrome c [Bacteroidia bacterium]
MNFTKIINLKTLTVGAIAGVMALGLTSCSNAPNSPGYEYMPDMYRSPVLKYYNTYTLNGDTLQSAMKPVAGTIARGCMPGIPAGMDYEKAGVYLKNPILFSDAVLTEGGAIYGKFCVHCHGDAGKGDGKVGLKLPGAPPAYDGPLKNLSEGKMFYTITNGKGLMGSHASQLTVEERWKVIYYVQKLQGHTPGQPAVADSVKTATAEVKEVKKEDKKNKI